MEQKINCTKWQEKEIADFLSALRSRQNVTIVVSVESAAEEEAVQGEKIAGYYLNKLGVPNHLRGYGYIKYGITRCMLDPEELESVTKILYPNIAKRYQTTSGKVEHGIRNAIAKAWERKENEIWSSIFGNWGKNMMSRPTNSQFLAAVTDYIKINTQD